MEDRSDINRCRQKFLLTGVAGISLLMSAAVASAQGLPSGALVVNGQVEFNQAGLSLNIGQQSPTAIISWDQFSIGQLNSVHFDNGSGATLNRVRGNVASQIDGVLTATGSVYLINPSGIAVGSTGHIETGGTFIGSTLDISNDDFERAARGESYTLKGTSNAVVRNAGAIGSLGGSVILVARTVENDGDIDAPNGSIGLLAGTEVLVQDQSLDGGRFIVRAGGSGTSVTNTGNIRAAEVELRANGGNVYALAGNRKGIISATGVENRGGRIFLTAGDDGSVTVAQRVSANKSAAASNRGRGGGEIRISGKNVTIASTVEAHGMLPPARPDGLMGDGGKIIVSGDMLTLTETARLNVSGAAGGVVLVGGDFQGGANAAANYVSETVKTAQLVTVAKGAVVVADGYAGDGGKVVIWSDLHTDFVGHVSATSTTGLGGDAEVSGKATLAFNGTANLLGQTGAGTLLLDPYDLEIVAGSGGDVTSSSTISTLGVDTLTDLLAGANVIVQTGAGGAQAGNITVSAAITWSEATTLTLQAHNNIRINAPITAVNGGLTLKAKAGTVASPTITTGASGAIDVGTFFLETGAWVQNSATLPAFAAKDFRIAGGQAATGGASAPTVTFARVTGGTGADAANAYAIADVYGLQGMATVRNAHYKLTNDIDASSTANWYGGAGFSPVGVSTSGNYFTGTFDGQDHVVTGLTINRPSQPQVGLFGYTWGSTIQNVGLQGGTVTGTVGSGSLVGTMYTGSISNAYATGKVTGTSDVGGLVGHIESGSISNAYATGGVTGVTNVGAGGLVGVSRNSSISNAYATGSVTGMWGAGHVGGLVGYMYTGSISNAYATGNVTGTTNVGGLVGSTNGGIISHAYATGDVTGTTNVGGLVGEMGCCGSSSSISHAYATGGVTGATNVGGLMGIKSSKSTTTSSFWNLDAISKGVGSGASTGTTGLTTAQFKDTAYFMSVAGAMGWDFENVWAPPGDGYMPELYAVSKVIRVHAGGSAIAPYGGTAGTWDGAAPGSVIYGAGLHISGDAYGTYEAFQDNPGVVTTGLLPGNSYTTEITGLNTSGDNGYRFIYTAGITMAKATITITVNDASKTYDGMGWSDGYGVTYSGFVNGDTVSILDGTLSYGGTALGAINAGSYTITASGLTLKSDYSDYYDINISYNPGALIITPAALTITANNASKTYDGLGYSGGNGVSYSGFVNGETAAVLGGTLAYGGTAQGAINVGTYAISASGLTSGNYDISYVAGGLTVTKAALTVTANNASKTYDGLGYSGGNGVSYSGFVGGETAAVLGGTLTYGGTAQGAINVGTYAISASGLTSGNYDISYVAGGLTVTKAALMVTANNASKTYDGLGYSGGNGVSYSGFVGGETAAVLGGTLAYGGTAQGAVNAGSYTLTASGLTSGNYDISYVAGGLTVNKATLTIGTHGTVATSRVYDGTLNAAVLTHGALGGVIAGDAVTLALTNTLYNSKNVTEADTITGTYTLSGAAAGNYVLSDNSFSTVGAITPASLTITASDASKTYDGTAWSGDNGVSYDGFVGGENASVLGGALTYGGTAQGAVNAGTYAITASGLSSGNYNISYVAGGLIVNKAALTITASDASKVYDGLGYSGGNGVSYSGFVNGETVAVLGGTLAYGGTAQGAVNAGTYAITASGLTSGNYDISYVAGGLTVNKAALKVTATDASKVYDGTAWSGGNDVTYDGFVGGEDASVLGGSLAYGGSAQGAINAGSYTLTASGLTSGNYDISYVAGGLTVTKAALTVTANNASKTYDGLGYSGGNGVSYSGFVGGETAAVLGGTLAYGGTAQGAVNAGTYAITASGLTSSNYDISYVAGGLTVNKATLTIGTHGTVATSRVYDQTTNVAKLTDGSLNGIIAGDTVTLNLGGLAYNSKDVATANIITGIYSLSGTGAGNYQLASDTFSVAGTITKAMLYVNPTADQVRKVGDSSYNIAYTVSGWQGYDNASLLAGSLSFLGDDSSGTRPIALGTLTAGGNYQLHLSGGMLKIEDSFAELADKAKEIEKSNPEFTKNTERPVSVIGSTGSIGLPSASDDKDTTGGSIVVVLGKSIAFQCSNSASEAFISSGSTSVAGVADCAPVVNSTVSVVSKQ